jgi:hypothetical protein
MKFNQGAFGQKIRVNFNQDVSSATAYSMTIEPQAGATLTKTPTLGTSAVTVDDSPFLANQYVEYTIEDGDFSEYAGRWRVKASATLSTETITTDYILFRVMP